MWEKHSRLREQQGQGVPNRRGCAFEARVVGAEWERGKAVANEGRKVGNGEE